MPVIYPYLGRNLDRQGSNSQMKFRNKARELSTMLGLRRKFTLPISPVMVPQKSARIIKKSYDCIDVKVHPQEIKRSKASDINHTRERFDRIAGDKQVFFAQSLNYAYLDKSPISVVFRLGNSSSDTVHVKVKVRWIVSSAGFQGMEFEALLYE